ncbi:CHAT domain-containing protein [Actinokineospora enzanensis]|uniref:CHAT domain-containing protein n=1 Tax=Actinokineospora enzanensis TaxID=155975 RepID=UPI00036F2955|nr:CHAT domain-containing protein [Actinokineospora enzanensis]
MRRVVVDVTVDAAAGWRVEVHVDKTPLVPPYPMARAKVAGRVLPAVPATRGAVRTGECTNVLVAAAAQPLPDKPVLDGPALDTAALDNAVRDKAVRDKAVRDKAVRDKAALDKTVLDEDPPLGSDGATMPALAGLAGAAPLVPDDLGGLLDRIRRRQGAPDDVARYGRWLFDCLLAPAWPAITADPGVAAERAVEIALRWPVDCGDLHRLVWESMRDETAPLAAYPGLVVAITRLVPGGAPTARPVVDIPRVLFATSVAQSDPVIRPGAMYMGLLRGLDAEGRCRATAVQEASTDRLAEACARYQPDIVHLVAHGVLLDDGRGALRLPRGPGEQDGGRRRGPVAKDATALVTALSAAKRLPLAVVLSACNTASAGESVDDPTDASPLAAELVAAGVPIVSAMAGEIGETACRLYTRRLAQALHEGTPPVEASAHGRRAALMGGASPDAVIDWALPTLYLSEHLDPDLAVVDATRSRRLTRVGEVLELRREPVFIGHEVVFDRVDRMLRDESTSSVLSVLATGAINALGGTRLLREIGWRVLRDGHLPLFLGPPFSLRPSGAHDLLGHLVAQVLKLMEVLRTTPFLPRTALGELSALQRRNLRAEFDAEAADREGEPIGMARKQLLKLVQDRAPMDPSTVRGRLADDLARLAEAVAEWGHPFGEHTRAILLCDDVHRWSSPTDLVQDAPVSALGLLLAMLSASGLGDPDHALPVVLTASMTAEAGPVVTEEIRRLRAHELRLEELSEKDRVLGYEWVLLHPWTTRPPEDRELFGATYTAGPDRANWERMLAAVGGQPTSVEGKLYYTIQGALPFKGCVRGDDERAWHAYVEANKGYRL